jgi:hypothetical protein
MADVKKTNDPDCSTKITTAPVKGTTTVAGAKTDVVVTASVCLNGEGNVVSGSARYEETRGFFREQADRVMRNNARAGSLTVGGEDIGKLMVGDLGQQILRAAASLANKGQMDDLTAQAAAANKSPAVAFNQGQSATVNVR